MCEHELIEGYTLEPIIYCKKCDKELDAMSKDELRRLTQRYYYKYITLRVGG